MEFRQKILYILSSVFALVLFLVNLPCFDAFEAHHVGVTATFKAQEVKLLIAKVYYDVDQKHGGETCDDYDTCDTCDKGEWVEIYNPSQYAVDLKNWQICDNSACNVLSNTSLILNPGNFAIITEDNSTFDYWDVPNDVLKIVLGVAIGNELQNDADMVFLKSPSNNIVDQMNWGVPSLGWPNYNSSVWNPGILDAPEGHMLGRIPLNPGPGFYDTDSPADWQDYALPHVGSIRVYQDGHLVALDHDLYGDMESTITWEAENQNGPDSDLSIDLLYIMDTNSNGLQDELDEVYIIAEDIENTGSYDWIVHSYPGYIWIKVIATGPENFMISDSRVGYRIYEPKAPEGYELSGKASLDSKDATLENKEAQKEEIGKEDGQENENPENFDNYDESSATTDDSQDKDAQEETEGDLEESQDAQNDENVGADNGAANDTEEDSSQENSQEQEDGAQEDETEQENSSEDNSQTQTDEGENGENTESTEDSASDGGTTDNTEETPIE